jgi:hypothetical protein
MPPDVSAVAGNGYEDRVLARVLRGYEPPGPCGLASAPIGPR